MTWIWDLELDLGLTIFLQTTNCGDSHRWPEWVWVWVSSTCPNLSVMCHRAPGMIQADGSSDNDVSGSRLSALTLDFSIQSLGLKDCWKSILKNCSDLEINNFRPLHWMCIDIGHWEDRKQADASFEPQLGLNLQLKRIFTCQYSTDHRVKTPAHHLILEQISGHYWFEHYFKEWWTH